MMKSTFLIISILLAMAALGLHLESRDQSIQGSKLRANGWTSSEPQKQYMQSEAARCREIGRVLAFIGLGFMSASLGFMVAARLRRERGFYSVPVFLLLAD